MKDRKIDVAPFVFSWVLACIHAKISEHQRENELRPAEAEAGKKSPPSISAPTKINFRPILLGFLKKWDKLSRKKWDKGVFLTPLTPERVLCYNGDIYA